ncbi:MAG: hypothetical protein LW855_07790 [Alphaproteobacteria bacterium]|jgi:hypothetical protein|nr:hypothetical protein [Thalassospira sp.]MCE2965677.1 hypothetical protein [Alphaproteobacteria bacterium]
MDNKVTVAGNGMLALPASLYEAMHLSPGQTMPFSQEDGVLKIFLPLEAEKEILDKEERLRRFEALRDEALASIPVSEKTNVVDEFIKERRKAAERELSDY